MLQVTTGFMRKFPTNNSFYAVLYSVWYSCPVKKSPAKYGNKSTMLQEQTSSNEIPSLT
jgi:hypothetical protein